MAFGSDPHIIEDATRLLEAGSLELPLPGAGKTRERFYTLTEIASKDLSLVRIVEGHVDAVAILAEAQKSAAPGLYGVWAAEPPAARLTAERAPAGWVLRGTKRYASGARGLARALVTAQTSDGSCLFDVDLRGPGIAPVDGTWRAVGMADTGSVDVSFDGAVVREDAIVGGPGFYTARRGFWHGAIGVAACWYGGALGAFRMLRDQLRRQTPSPHQLAHVGAIAASCRTMGDAIDDAANDIDAAKLVGHVRALLVRHVVEQGCQDVLTRVGRAGGTGPLTFDRAHAQRAADLVVYLRQHHAERDLEALGRAVLEDESWS